MLRPVAALVAATGLLLSGCGVEGTQFHPGVAAQVGDDTITSNRVDSLADGFCTALTKQFQQANQVVPMRVVRFYVAGELTVRSAVEQLAERYDAKPGTAYAQARSQAEAAAQDQKMSDHAAAAYVELAGIDPYVSDVLTSVGKAVLASQGTGSPTTDAEQSAGAKALDGWFRSHQVDVDPRYGFVIKDGQPTPTDTDVSLAVSTLAKEGTAQKPEAAYSSSLPSNMVCG